MKNIKKQSPEEQVKSTLSLIKSAVYQNGICGKLFTYLKHVERLLTEADFQDLPDHQDALELFRDYMLRLRNKQLTYKDYRQFILDFSTEKVAI